MICSIALQLSSKDIMFTDYANINDFKCAVCCYYYHHTKYHCINSILWLPTKTLYYIILFSWPCCEHFNYQRVQLCAIIHRFCSASIVKNILLPIPSVQFMNKSKIHIYSQPSLSCWLHNFPLGLRTHSYICLISLGRMHAHF